MQFEIKNRWSGKVQVTAEIDCAAAALIYLASDPALDRVPDFYCSNASALADMKARAATQVPA